MSARKLTTVKAVSADESLRRRSESSVMIRKEKRNEHLDKKRGIFVEEVAAAAQSPEVAFLNPGMGPAAVPANVFGVGSPGGGVGVPGQVLVTPPVGPATPQPPISSLMTPEALEEAKANLYSADHVLVQKAAQNLRRILSIEKNPPIQIVINAGLVPQLVNLLQYDQYPIIQFEAAWALTNIASGTSNDTRAVVDANASPHLIRLLGSKSEDVREQCAWALGNIAGDSLVCRDLTLRQGVLPALLTIFNERSRISTIRNSTWTLSNLFRGKPGPAIENVRLALPCLASLIFSHDVETITDACWALSYISDGTNDKIQMVLDQGVAAKLVELLNSGNSAIQTPALRTIGNIVTGTDQQTQAVINLGILPAISALLLHEKKNIRKEACWLLSNITAGTKDQIQAVIDCGGGDTFYKLIEVLKTNDFDVQKEACWAIANATSGGNDQQILQIVRAGAIPPLCAMLATHDAKIVQVALEGLDNILKAASEFGAKQHTKTLDQVIEVFHITGGISAIEQLQEHANHHIYERAASMVNSYFAEFEDSDGDVEDPTIAPANANDQFNFGNNGGDNNSYNFNS